MEKLQFSYLDTLALQIDYEFYVKIAKLTIRITNLQENNFETGSEAKSQRVYMQLFQINISFISASHAEEK